MGDEGELISDLIDVSGSDGVIDLVDRTALQDSLRRLIAETRSGNSEYSGFQNFIPGVPTSARPVDE
ncbi:hypothetical protein [Actinoplanes couchii]|uniref:FXSXX-COOH protein n=1 Tax=Actinoplanes couchii TaxID=403638 RepID=A0ABQ3WZZ9_9ACTN|nr:hypothetical protein [Actinoplanes couchii]MDR6316230.1 hypothetical protein [Actinoplanes couchii]GID51844.1 hypothetical protein Aco03nite_002480 [Actinoplanes couchii]